MKRLNFQRVMSAMLACTIAALGCMTTGPAAMDARADANADAKAKQYCDATINLINNERVAAGLRELAIIPILVDAADIRANEAIILDKHVRPDGSAPSSILISQNFFYSVIGENLGTGPATPADLITAWMTSDNHRTLVLSDQITHAGIAYALDTEKNVYHWCMYAIGSYSSGEPYIYDDQYIPKRDRADVDGSLVINAKDASAILKYSAAESAGLDYTVPYWFKKAGDINEDGNVDSIDASIILCYTAARGTGEQVSLDDFIWK